MLLLLDVDGDHRTGWEGYDFLIDRARPADGACTVERNAGGSAGGSGSRSARPGSPAGATRCTWPCRARCSGLGADRVAAGKLRSTSSGPTTCRASGDVLDFLTHGDVAPNGRFNYRYRE